MCVPVTPLQSAGARAYRTFLLLAFMYDVLAFMNVLWSVSKDVVVYWIKYT